MSHVHASMISLGAQEVWGRSMSQKLGGRANIVCLGISDKNLRGQRRSRARVSESRGGRAGGGFMFGLMNQTEEGRIVGMCARRTMHQIVFKRLMKRKEG
jgi:hypothetical protein